VSNDDDAEEKNFRRRVIGPLRAQVTR
jgi:hypothetical protein